MPKTIYNEGRVVGLSSHEIYVKEALSEFPDLEPATEREWLASSLGSGASILYKMPTHLCESEDQEWVHEFELPGDSRLGAANTITASWFDGTAEVGANNWATKVTSYGDLLLNTPDISGKDNPTISCNHSKWATSKEAEFKDFLRIIDGVVIQPGKWTATGGSPANDLAPDLSKNPYIRIKVKGSITTSFYILFTGFTIRTVLAGTTGLDGSTATARPSDGDFLGPAIYPWANKIIFSLPSSYTAEFEIGKYLRSIGHEDFKTVADTSIIDMKSAQFDAAFKDKLDATVGVDVKDFSTLGDGEAVLTVYAKDSQYCPALWATYVEATGNQVMYPVDIVAPGSVKMFQNGSVDEMKKYEETYPGTFTISRANNGTISTLDENGVIKPVASISRKNIVTTDDKEVVGKAIILQAGSVKELALSIGDGQTETPYTVAKNPDTSVPANKLGPGMILKCIKDNYAIDLLGDRLRSAKTTLTKANTSSSTAPYLEFGSGNNIVRLYIANKAPTGDIPDGSIGIGWGFDS